MGCTSSSVAPKDPYTVSLDHFEVHRIVGEGGFGKVNAVCRKSDGKWFAMKTLTKARVLARNNVAMVYNERNTLKDVPATPWIINLHHTFQDPDNLYVVMDIAFGGDLRYHLNHSDKKGLPLQSIRLYMLGSLFGLEVLHNAGIVHRDIKPDNILIGEDGYAVLTDLGVSKNLNDKGVCEGRSGTSSYLGPEVYSQTSEHGRPIDIFALGVTMYELFMMRKPFDKVAMKQWAKQRYHKETVDDSLNEFRRPLTACEKAADLVTKMTQFEPSKRITIPEIFNHPFFAEIDVEEVRRKEAKPLFMPDKKKAYCEVNTADVMEVMGDGNKQDTEKHSSMKRDIPAIMDGDKDPFGTFDFNTKLPKPEPAAG